MSQHNGLQTNFPYVILMGDTDDFNSEENSC